MRTQHNDYIWQVDADHMEGARTEIRRILTLIRQVEGKGDYVFRIDCIINGCRNSFVNDIIGLFLRDMLHSGSGVYTCYAVAFDLGSREGWVRFCEDFLMDFLDAALASRVGYYPYEDGCEWLEAWYSGHKGQLKLNSVSVPKEELGTMNPEEMTLFRDTLMSMLPAKVSLKYFLLNYYQCLWENEAEDDGEYSNFASYHVAQA